MSYSFSIKADTKAEAISAVSDQLAQVVASQPTHASDRDAAQAAAEAFVNILAEPADGQCVSVAVYGSLSWRQDDQSAPAFTSANVSVTAGLATKDA